MTSLTVSPAVAVSATAGRRVARAGAHLLLDAALVLAVLLFGFLAVGPRLLPYRTVTMLTGSMRPTIPVGAVAVDVAEPLSALRAGQIISFHAPVAGQPVVTHRVVSVQHRDGRVLIRTRGDANSGQDPWIAVVHGTTVWRVRAVIPHLGSAVRALRSPSLHLALVWVAPAALLAWLLAAIWMPSRRSRSGDPEPTSPYPLESSEGGSCSTDAAPPEQLFSRPPSSSAASQAPRPLSRR